jgi:hypothetical protein
MQQIIHRTCPVSIGDNWFYITQGLGLNSSSSFLKFYSLTLDLELA